MGPSKLKRAHRWRVTETRQGKLMGKAGEWKWNTVKNKVEKIINRFYSDRSLARTLCGPYESPWRLTWASLAQMTCMSQLEFIPLPSHPVAVTQFDSAQPGWNHTASLFEQHTHLSKKKKSSNGPYSSGGNCQEQALKFAEPQGNQVSKQSSLRRELSALLRFREREVASVQKGFIDCT